MNYRSIDYLMSVNDGINPYGFVHHYKKNYRMKGGVTVNEFVKNESENFIKELDENKINNMTVEEIKEMFDKNNLILNGEYLLSNGGWIEPTELTENEYNKILNENEKLINRLEQKSIYGNIGVLKNIEEDINIFKFLEDLKDDGKLEEIKKIREYMSDRINDDKTNTLSGVAKYYNSLIEPDDDEFGIAKRDNLIPINNDIKKYEKDKGVDLLIYGQTIEDEDFKKLFKYEEINDKNVQKLHTDIKSIETAKKYLIEVAKKIIKKSSFDTKEKWKKEITKWVYKNLFDTDGKPWAGKLIEYNVCGEQNQNAIKMYKPISNMQVSDFLLEQYDSQIDVIGTPAGSSFPHDNIDIINKIINEMKDYSGLNYDTMLKYNKQLMIIYYRKLEKEKVDLKEAKTKLEEQLDVLEIKLKLKKTSKKQEEIDSKQKEIDSKQKEIDSKQKEIDSKQKILDDTTLFRREFYKNNNYLGVTITMSKFDNDLIKPPNNNEVNSDAVINHIKNKCDPIYNPEMDGTKKIYGYTKKTTKGNPLYDEKINEQIKENVFSNRDDIGFEYYITVRFNNCVGVYNYSDDIIMGDSYPLNWYKAGYCKTDSSKLNSVKFPIENFIIKK